MPTANTGRAKRGKAILVVDDNAGIVSSLKLVLGAKGHQVTAASTVAAALKALESPPDIVILDVRLPDGSGVEVARAAQRLHPPPFIVVVSGEAHAVESFQLAQLGASAYLSKPYGAADIERAIEGAGTSSTELERASRRAVGSLSLMEAREVVRETMTIEALEATQGNRSKAAGILNVSRQAVQAVIREVDGDSGNGK